MKPKLLGQNIGINHSLNFHKDVLPHFLRVYHFHAELELVYIKKSTGTRFLGNSIENFKAGDLVLIGENLPHMWQNDPVYFQDNNSLVAEALVVHFRKDFAGKDFLERPELASVKRLLELSARGIQFRGKRISAIVAEIEKLAEQNEFKRLMTLIQLLKLLSTCRDYKILVSPGFIDTWSQTEHRRLEGIYAFVYSNFKDRISLAKVANLAGMHSSAFCRFFKRTTGKTFFHFLNEVRVGYACRLLIDSRYNISEVAYACGYNNLSNFNRQFKAINGRTPTEYIMLVRPGWNR